MDLASQFEQFLQGKRAELIKSGKSEQEIDQEIDVLKKAIGVINSERPISPKQNHKLQQFEKTLLEYARIIYKALKNCIDNVNLLHVFGVNFDIDENNVQKFLELFCSSIFQCGTISIVSTMFEAPDFLNTMDEENVDDKDVHKALVDELENSLIEKREIGVINFDVSKTFKKYIDPKDFPVNVVYKFEKEDFPFYLIFHYVKEDVPFREYFMDETNSDKFMGIMQFIVYVCNCVAHKTLKQHKEDFLMHLQRLKLIVVSMYKYYFLIYLSKQLKPMLDCEVVINGSPSKEKGPETGRMLEIIVSDDEGKVSFKPSFQWNTENLNSKISVFWAKFQTLARGVEDQIYYQLQNSENSRLDALMLQFSKNGTLIYQNAPVAEEYGNLIEVENFLLYPNSRAMTEVLGQDKKFLKMIQDFLNEHHNSPSTVTYRKSDHNGIFLDFVARKKVGKNKHSGFSIIVSYGRIKNNINKLELDIADMQKDADGEKSVRVKDSMSNVKSMFNFGGKSQDKHRKFIASSAMSIFGDADFEKIANSLAGLYVPDEINSPTTEEVLQRSLSIKRDKLQKDFSFRDFNAPSSFKPKFEGDNSKINAKVEFNKDFLVPTDGDEASLHDWSFDVYKLENPNAKARIAWVVLNRMNMMRKFKVDPEVFCNFIIKLRQKYNKNNNPFHNFEHALSVMHATHYLIRQTTNFDDLVQFGLVTSALCHDTDHTGRTNAFEIAKSTKLALRYHDRSPLEQHHAAVSLKIMNLKKQNIFQNVEGEDYKKLKKDFISNILFTDMKEHMELVKNFKDLTKRIEEEGEENFGWNQEDIRIYSGMLLHCADLSGPSKVFPVAHKWSIKINQEFTNQVRDEEKFNLPVTPYFKDLDKKHIMAKQEISFISFVIKPLWETYNQFSKGACEEQINNIKKNIEEWEKLKQEGLKEAGIEEETKTK